MDEPVSFLQRVECARTRRLWLLAEALRCAPLDRAVELARRADAFILDARTPAASRLPAKPETATTQRPRTLPGTVGQLTTAAPANTPPRLQLSPEQRAQLLDGLAKGASNAELAQALSLTARQVQGVRMGAAREIASRRVTSADAIPGACVCADDVIRYLRQQDDVVVPQEDGCFLVNARFRLDLAELMARANRMRARQGKPEFRLSIGHAAPRPDQHPASRHPILWKQPSSLPAR